MSEVIITIAPDGKTKVEAKGAPGKDCLKATEPYEKATRGNKVADTPTSEMNQVRVGGGVHNQR